MDVLAVIPATAPVASRPLAGRPLALWTLDQARAARPVTRVALVANDGPLAEAARAEGADVVAPAAGEDGAEALGAALAALAAGVAPQLLVLLDPAFPLLDASVIDAAVRHLLRCGADSLVAVTRLSGAIWLGGEAGAAQPLPQPAAAGTLGQGFVETGVLLAVRAGIFEQAGTAPAGRIALFDVPALAALAVGDGDDLAPFEGLVTGRARAAARARLQAVKLLALDFDGVMTDNRVWVLEDGREAVACSRGDGMGLELLRKRGVPVVVISKEINPVVTARCRKLKIPCRQGIEDKLSVFEQVIGEHGLTPAQVAFFGNDVNDLACMHAAGVAIAPKDAHPAALAAADIVTRAKGGYGAVREICDLLVARLDEEAGPAR